ncbi:putative ribonuclease H-like domain-containing protein [Tanacetum coccineum]
MKEIFASYANKLSPTSLTKANLRKLDANVLNDADYDIWLPFSSVDEMIREIFIFLNKWSPSVSLLNEDLSRDPVWVKFHDVPLVAHTSDGLSLIAKKIGSLMMLDSYTNSICLESWGRSSYVRILIEINACNDFSDNLFMAVPKLKGIGYTKETIRVEYKMDKGMGGSFGDDDEGFIEVKKKKSGGNNGGNKNFKPDSVKPKTHCRPKAKQSTEGATQKTTPFVCKKNVSTLFPLVSEDEDESVENKMTCYLASKPLGVGNGTKRLLEQWRETYVNADYNLYDDDMYEEGLEECSGSLVLGDKDETKGMITVFKAVFECYL